MKRKPSAIESNLEKKVRRELVRSPVDTLALYALQQEIAGLIAQETSLRVACVPQDVWTLVMGHYCEDTKPRCPHNVCLEMGRLEQVCTMWAKVVKHFLFSRYEKEKYVTALVLKKTQSRTELKLINNTEVRNRDIQQLTALTKLEIIDQCGWIDNDSIKGLTQLTALTLHADYISCKGIRKLTNLTSLAAKETNIGNEGLKDLTKLEKLKLGKRTQVSTEGVMKLTQLKTLVLKGNKWVGNQALWKLSKLKSLRLSPGEGITENGLLVVASRLTKLNLDTNERITDKTVSQMTALTTLVLDRNTNISVEALKTLSRLKKLNLGRNEVIPPKPLEQLGFVQQLHNVHEWKRVQP